MPAKITIELTLSQANTLAEGMKRLRRNCKGVDNSIHATAKEREDAHRHFNHSLEILELLGETDSDPEGQT